MPISEEPYYCHEQIEIPPLLPDILKQFTKAAIRTQPKDPLVWSYEYFKSLAYNEVPPVKERLEMAISSQKTDTGLTPGLLKILHNQLGGIQRVNLCKIEEKWLALALPLERLQEIWRIGNFGDDARWLHFFALAATQVAPTLATTMKLLCELLTSDPEGGHARISFELFSDLYRYLAQIDGNVPLAHQEQLLTYLSFDVHGACGLISPRDFLRPSAPKLHPNQCQ
ncbi:cAMP dependent protein kinase regulatory [Echinococcus multilocularis]|uniref:cAMP dependent protein kinase regulatory n=1 Tax=Echinococcus multilocularis TaxID=6211 RepID=A0A068YD79_ECHMU|nr:cAMP dependent protein kinase regulatory [Echinococcus multilocularis]